MAKHNKDIVQRLLEATNDTNETLLTSQEKRITVSPSKKRTRDDFHKATVPPDEAKHRWQQHNVQSIVALDRTIMSGSSRNSKQSYQRYVQHVQQTKRRQHNALPLGRTSATQSQVRQEPTVNKKRHAKAKKEQIMQLIAKKLKKSVKTKKK